MKDPAFENALTLEQPASEVWPEFFSHNPATTLDYTIDPTKQTKANEVFLPNYLLTHHTSRHAIADRLFEYPHITAPSSTQAYTFTHTHASMLHSIAPTLPPKTHAPTLQPQSTYAPHTAFPQISSLSCEDISESFSISEGSWRYDVSSFLPIGLVVLMLLIVLFCIV